MKNLLLGLCLTLASCVGTSTGYSRANVAPAAEIVLERHDAYVQSDLQLDPTAQLGYLTESQVARSILAQDPVPALPFRNAMLPVIERQDEYLDADTRLTAPQRVTRKRTSELLRRLLDSNNK